MTYYKHIRYSKLTRRYSEAIIVCLSTQSRVSMLQEAQAPNTPTIKNRLFAPIDFIS